MISLRILVHSEYFTLIRKNLPKHGYSRKEHAHKIYQKQEQKLDVNKRVEAASE